MCEEPNYSEKILPDNFTCKSSSYYNDSRIHFPCTMAIDSISTEENSWAADNEDIGAWIYIQFERYYKLSGLTFHRRFWHSGYKNKDEIKQVILTYSDQTNAVVNMESTKEWTHLITPLKSTKYINITVKKIFNNDKMLGTLHVGFSEIEFYGHPGMNIYLFMYRKISSIN